MITMQITLINKDGNEIIAYVTVTEYTPEVFLLVTGSGYGDCEPPEPEDIEFYLSYEEGAPPSDYLMSLVTDEVYAEILMKYKA